MTHPTTAAATPAAQPTKPNLASVMPMSAPPPEQDLQSRTPMDRTIVPFTAIDLVRWRPWLFSRLHAHWPTLNDFYFPGIVQQLMADNANLFVRTAHTIMLATCQKECIMLDPRPVVDIIFGFKHHPDEVKEDEELVKLIDHISEWGKRRGARLVRAKYPQRIDGRWGNVRKLMLAEETRSFVIDLDREQPTGTAA